MPERRRVSTSCTLCRALLSVVALSLGGCVTTPLLEVRFDGDDPGSRPGTTQELGTVVVDPGAGSVLVAETPARGIEPMNWAHISHPTSITPQTSLRAMMSAPAGEGSFSVSALLYVPSGAGVATIQLEPFGQPETSYLNFIHVDLLPDGTLRIDDGPATFGQYPHDQVFILSIDLEVGADGATARVAPSGAGTSGSAEVAISAVSLARQFGAVRIWMGYQHAGDFFVDNVLVLRRSR